MKIVDRAQFLDLPSGTLFREYEPCNFRELKVKGGTDRHTLMSGMCADGFSVMHLDFVDAPGSTEALDILFTVAESGESFRFDYDGWMRDGWSPESNKQLYAVYDREDVEQLIEFLQRSLR